MPSMDRNHADQIGLERNNVYACRICNKGFPSGRALGGHMGAHSVAPATAEDDEEEDESVTQSDPDADGTSPVSGSKRGRGCENCGKEFPCWKSFLEHGKCVSGAEVGSDDDVESFHSSPPEARARDVVDAVATGWHKGKRSRRAKTGGASEEEDLARSLMMLSAARIEAAGSEADEHSCASEAADAPKGRVFACATCNKEFASHQALGGHRASHKKVKGCFAGRAAAPLDGAPLEPEEAARLEQIAGELAAVGASSAAAIVPIECPAPLDARKPEKKPRMHECSVCHREFTSGQALGGHKRSHWHTEKLPEHGVELPPLPSATNLHSPAIPVTPAPLHAPKSLPLDLNLPASIPAGELAGVMREIGSSSLPLEASIAMYLKGLIDPGRINWKRGGDDGKKKKSKDTEIINVEDEEETRVTLAKLSEDIKNTEGGSSAWLQVGIGSSCKAEERKSKPTRRSGRDDEQNL